MVGKMKNSKFRRAVEMDQARRVAGARFVGSKNGKQLFRVSGGAGRADLTFTGQELIRARRRSLGI
jgi:hypothetical protein